MAYKDDFELEAEALETAQDLRFQASKDKLKFFDAKERRIIAGIEFMRSISKTYKVNHPDQ